MIARGCVTTPVPGWRYVNGCWTPPWLLPRPVVASLVGYRRRVRPPDVAGRDRRRGHGGGRAGVACEEDPVIIIDAAARSAVRLRNVASTIRATDACRGRGR